MNKKEFYVSGILKFYPERRYYIVLTGNLTKDCVSNGVIKVNVIGAKESSVILSKESFFECNWGPSNIRFEKNSHDNLAVELPPSEIKKSLDLESGKGEFQIKIAEKFWCDKVDSVDVFVVY